ncbi:MAG TPA: hypothetical protein VIC82_10865 [Candidatus Nanopelagicales bacterium]|jgi:hypothetical protein
MAESVDPVDPASLDLVVAALRADAADVASLTRALSAGIGDALPPGMVTVERDQSLSGRLRGREAVPKAVTISFPERQLELRTGKHGSEAEIRRVVRGVVISRQQVGIDEWIRSLATELTALAERDASARTALAALLGIA